MSVSGRSGGNILMSVPLDPSLCKLPKMLLDARRLSVSPEARRSVTGTCLLNATGLCSPTGSSPLEPTSVSTTRWVQYGMVDRRAVTHGKDKDYAKHLADALPDYADFYFDNVGGEILNTMFTLTKRYGYISACGAISGEFTPCSRASATLQQV